MVDGAPNCHLLLGQIIIIHHHVGDYQILIVILILGCLVALREIFAASGGLKSRPVSASSPSSSSSSSTPSSSSSSSHYHRHHHHNLFIWLPHWVQLEIPSCEKPTCKQLSIFLVISWFPKCVHPQGVVISLFMRYELENRLRAV